MWRPLGDNDGDDVDDAWPGQHPMGHPPKAFWVAASCSSRAWTLDVWKPVCQCSFRRVASARPYFVRAPTRSKMRRETSGLSRLKLFPLQVIAVLEVSGFPVYLLGPRRRSVRVPDPRQLELALWERARGPGAT